MNIAIIGYGSVGKALTALLDKQKDLLTKGLSKLVGGQLVWWAGLVGCKNSA